ncbi:hypothetical protein KVK99_00925 [Helicobacter pylori]|nr:hypothetical protein KVK99_00925 [Helicobacter pylori]
MRQEHETATSFKELQAITQAIQALKKGAQSNATNQESEQALKPGLRPKTSAQAKKGTLKPTKGAFSERQSTAFKNNSQAGAKTSFKTKESNNANAFKSEQANNSSLREKPSEQALKPGLTTDQEKGGKNEAYKKKFKKS